MLKPSLEVLEDRTMPSGFSDLPPELNPANIGFFNSGIGNISFGNSGDYNTGFDNSGSSNIGFGNTGSGNIGFFNSGSSNIGFGNSGSVNTGFFNSGQTIAQAATPYVGWLSAAAAQAEAAASQARATASAFETAIAATVHPSAIASNRASLVTLVTTNLFGQNAPAIAATEAEYAEMWAQDVAAMSGYAGAAAAAPTTGVVPAAADEVSAAIAALFAGHAQMYQALNSEAAAFHEKFVQTLTDAGNAYAATEVAIAGAAG